ncbi:hypothetical protein V7S43_007309 [Phytophthora oleae]|uniref:PspA/IM30 family protein n=1 Tax=Phytophthora oleae TaxID=2107226 RepID=A0ABD3FN62_9STRA
MNSRLIVFKRKLTREITAVRAELVRAEQQAAPYVEFCQRRYDLLRTRLEDTQLRLAETESALADRRGNSLEIACLQDRLRAHRRIHEDVETDFQRQMDEVEGRLTASSPPGGSAQLAQLAAERHTAAIERDAAVIERDAAVIVRDAAQEERDTVRGELHARTASLQDAENAARLLR